MSRRDSSGRRRSKAVTSGDGETHSHPAPSAAQSKSTRERHDTEPLLAAPEGCVLDAGGLLIVHPPLSSTRFTGASTGTESERLLDTSQHEKYTCRFCHKTNVGKNARSVARRHLQDKHDIPLSQQTRRSRWDKPQRTSTRSQSLVKRMKRSERNTGASQASQRPSTLSEHAPGEADLPQQPLDSSPMDGRASLVSDSPKPLKKKARGRLSQVDRMGVRHSPVQPKRAHGTGSAEPHHDWQAGDNVFNDASTSSVVLPRPHTALSGSARSHFTLGTTSFNDSPPNLDGQGSSRRLLFRQARVIPSPLVSGASATQRIHKVSLQSLPKPQVVDTDTTTSPTPSGSPRDSRSLSPANSELIDNPVRRRPSKRQHPSHKSHKDGPLSRTPDTGDLPVGLNSVSATRFWRTSELSSPPSSAPARALFRHVSASNLPGNAAFATTDNLFLCSPRYARELKNEHNSSPNAARLMSHGIARNEGPAERRATTERPPVTAIPTPKKTRDYTLSSPGSMDYAISLGLAPSHPTPATPGMSSIISHRTPGDR